MITFNYLGKELLITSIEIDKESLNIQIIEEGNPNGKLFYIRILEILSKLKVLDKISDGQL